MQCLFFILAFGLSNHYLAILLLLQIDAPVAPGAKGSRVFLRGISDELQNTYRNRIFGISKRDLLAAADK